MKNKTIDIPSHQRAEIWSAKKKEALIDHCMRGFPIPNITLNHIVQEGKQTYWLEDGQQRCWSLFRFFEGEVAWKGRYYNDLTPDEQFRFKAYKVHVLVFRNATREEIITIFSNFQKGVPLTSGQRYHAWVNMGPNSRLIDFAIECLMTPGSGFYERATNVWGPHSMTNDKKPKNFLKNAMALIGGAAHGPEFITTSYDILGPKVAIEFDAGKVRDRIDTLLSIFEEADRQHPITPAAKKKLWPAGHINGFILYSLINFPDDHRDRLVEGWVKFLVQLRRGEKALKTSLHAKSSKANNLNSAKWRIGYENVFVAAPDIDTETASTESSDEDE